MAKGKKGRSKRNGQSAAYALEHRREKSHVRRISRHLARYGESDKVAVEALKTYKVAAGMR